VRENAVVKAPKTLFAWSAAVLLAAVTGPPEGSRAQFREQPESGFKAPSGQIAFVRDQDLWVMEADGSKPRLLLKSGRIAKKNIAWSLDNQEILFCQSGTLQYQSPAAAGGAKRLYDIFAVRVSSPHATKQLTGHADSHSPSHFPDGQRIAFVRDLHALEVYELEPLYQVFVGGKYGSPAAWNLNRGEPTGRLQVLSPAVSPDGQTIACVVTSDTLLSKVDTMKLFGIAFFPAAGFNGRVDEARERAEAIPGGFGPAWSPDGKHVAYVDTHTRALGLYDVESQTKKILFKPRAGSGVSNTTPSWSSDGNWIVFANLKGHIFMVDRNGKNLRGLTTLGGDAVPAFSH
jgi:Tol biopolymer transport system component